MTPTREQALAIWMAATEAADPFALSRDAAARLAVRGRALVVGGGKAGAAMAAGVEAVLGDRAVGVVNVPQGATQALNHIALVEARPAGSNHPTPEGVAGVVRMLA